MDEVYIFPRRLKCAVRGVILLIAAAGMALTAALPYIRPQIMGGYYIVIIVVAIISGTGFLASSAFYLANALRRLQIVADKEGIKINCTILPIGFIPWSEVAEIGYDAPQNLLGAITEPELNALILVLSSPEEYKRGRNILQRIHILIHRGRVKVPLSLCNGKGGEIASAINELYKSSRKDI